MIIEPVGNKFAGKRIKNIHIPIKQPSDNVIGINLMEKHAQQDTEYRSADNGKLLAQEPSLIHHLAEPFPAWQYCGFLLAWLLKSGKDKVVWPL